MAKKKQLSNTAVIALMFALAIVIGSILLSLPIASANKTATPYIDALFTATTSICVTGLVTVTTAFHWSLFGKIVILILIQIGGLGIVTVMSAFYLGIKKRASLSTAMLLGDVFNAPTRSGIQSFLWRVLKYTGVSELIFFLAYLPVFIKDFGPKGIWVSLFHSISTFCNAGIDIIGGDSLIPYNNNAWLCIVTMIEIICGGIGFIFMIEISDKIKARVKDGQKKRLSLHARLVIFSTIALILIGAALFLVFEFNNEKTIGTMSTPQKILNALFESVTLRTAGFATFSQAGLTEQSALLTHILMFIGGSPTGTAGGIKTVTAAVLVLSAIFSVVNSDDLVIAKKRIRITVIKKAVCITIIALLIVFISIFVGLEVTDASYKTIAFEVISALGTVGLSMDYTASLNLAGKILIIICMFIGRIGPFSLLVIFSRQNSSSENQYPEEEVIIG